MVIIRSQTMLISAVSLQQSMFITVVYVIKLLMQLKWYHKHERSKQNCLWYRKEDKRVNLFHMNYIDLFF